MLVNKILAKLVDIKLKKNLEESIFLKKNLTQLSKQIKLSVRLIFNSILKKKKIMICGNGGSAADAQHLAAEFLVRLRPKINRRPLPFISLALDSSTLTASANDYGYNQVFERNLDALGNKGDVLICVSTSGMSKNILNALKMANKKKIHTISFLGSKGGKCKNFSEINLIVPSNITARIQECHIFLGHHILECVEDLLIKYKKI